MTDDASSFHVLRVKRFLKRYRSGGTPSNLLWIGRGVASISWAKLRTRAVSVNGVASNWSATGLTAQRTPYRIEASLSHEDSSKDIGRRGSMAGGGDYRRLADG